MIIDRPLRSHISGLRRLWKQAFGDSDTFLDGFFQTGFSFDRCRCLLLDNTLAAALYWFDCAWRGKKVAYIYAVATDDAFRGKGLCRLLMEDTHKHLQSLGYAGAVLVPGNEGLYSLYRKFGYLPFCPMHTVTVAAGDPVEIMPVSPDNYRLRRQQENGISHSQIALDFYATYGGFYQATDAVFAVSAENGTAYFQEFLGNDASLPGIVAALGCKTGEVLLPGGDRNTAMYLPFDSDPTLPAYLGIPLN